MVTGYFVAPGRTTRSRRKLGPQMHGMHGPPVCGYALVFANLVPSYGLNSFTVRMERETPLSNLRCLAAYPFMGKASRENLQDKSSFGTCASRKGLIPETKGEVTLTETLSVIMTLGITVSNDFIVLYLCRWIYQNVGTIIFLTLCRLIYLCPLKTKYKIKIQVISNGMHTNVVMLLLEHNTNHDIYMSINKVPINMTTEMTSS